MSIYISLKMGIFIKNKENKDSNLKKAYYKLLQKTIKKVYDKNHYNTFNLAYSLHSNKFATRRTSTKLFFDENRNDIVWKDYLLQKLEPSPNDLEWKQSLYNFISKDPFSNHYIFQNRIFFEELSVLTKPKLNYDEDNLNSLSMEPILSPLDTKELKSLSRNISTHSLNPEYENDIFDINDYEQHLTMNISMESITSSMIKQDPKYEAKLNSYKIKLYIQIIKRHLDNKYHPLNIIINKFIDFFIPYLNNACDYCESKKRDKNECAKRGKQVIKQIQNFIEIMQVVLKLFYSKSVNYRYFIDEKDEIINLISYILFNIPRIYKLISKIFFFMNYDKIENLQSKFIKLGNLTPKEIGVNPKFCLDKETDKFMKDYKNNKKSKDINKSGELIKNELMSKSNRISKIVQYFESQNNEKNKNLQNINNIEIEKDNEIIFDKSRDDNLSINSHKILKNKTSKYNENKFFFFEEEDNISVFNIQDFKNTIDSYQDKMNIKKILITSLENECFPSLPKLPNLNNITNSNEPYTDAINYLKQIDAYKVPLEKLTVIALISVIITDCIDKYWDSLKNEIPPKFLNIDADELMCIYLYIIYQLKMPSLYVHLDFIRYFTTPISKQSMIGYYFTALEGCLNFILKAEDKSSFLKN